MDAANFLPELKNIIVSENAAALVVGRPRGLSGQQTAQTKRTEIFAEELKTLGLPVYFQDEAVTSKQAEAELQARGKPYKKSDIDALAAAYILEDWLREHKELPN